MLARTLLFITLFGLIAPTLAFVECYPKANCQVIEPRYYQVPVSEEHEGFNGQFTFFRSTACACEPALGLSQADSCLNRLPQRQEYLEGPHDDVHRECCCRLTSTMH